MLSSRIKYFLLIILITIDVFLILEVTKVAANQIKSEQISTVLTVTTTLPTETIAEATPKSFYFLKDPEKKPKVQAEEYVIGDLDTGEIILGKNDTEQLPIASLSKLMTATVDLETLNQDQMTKISAQALATYGNSGYFHLGEKISVGTLLYPLLMESSNDAAEQLAEVGGHDTFLSEMNQKAKDLGMTSTTYQDPSGLTPFNVSTATDLFKLTQYIQKNLPVILQVPLNHSYKYSLNSQTWFSIDQFLRDPGYTGGKSGYTDEARETVVSTFAIPLGQSGTRHIAIVLLKTPNRHEDVENIVSYLKKNVYYGTQSDTNSSWVQAKEGAVPEIEAPNYATLLFGGDIMLDRGVRNSVMQNFGGDYSALFNNLDIIKNSDITVANLEGPATDQGTDLHNLYSFRMDPSVLPAMQGAGINILSVANNHIGDWGLSGFTDTLSQLRENEILYIGGGNSKQEAEDPTIEEVNGIKVGYLAFSDKGPNMPAGDNQPGILLASDPNFDSIIQNASKQVDDLVVYFHWGDEYATTHNDRQEQLAHEAVDDGAKIVVGAHPHVIEDTEIYKKGFIAYSLGNFIFDQGASPDTMQGLLLQIKVNKNGPVSIFKNIVQLNSAFQPSQVIKGKEEKLIFGK